MLNASLVTTAQYILGLQTVDKG